MKLRLHSYAVTRSTGRLLLALLLSLYLASKSIERNGEREQEDQGARESESGTHIHTGTPAVSRHPPLAIHLPPLASLPFSHKLSPLFLKHSVSEVSSGRVTRGQKVKGERKGERIEERQQGSRRDLMQADRLG